MWGSGTGIRSRAYIFRRRAIVPSLARSLHACVLTECVNCRATAGLEVSGGVGHNGGVWEWTSTVFDKHEGFEQSRLYPGYVFPLPCTRSPAMLTRTHSYSTDFFDGQHQVVVRLALSSIFAYGS